METKFLKYIKFINKIYNDATAHIIFLVENRSEARAINIFFFSWLQKMN